MKHLESPLPFSPESEFDRRQFLKGAAGVLALATAGFPTLAKATGTSVAPICIAFWDGGKFVPVNQLASGDSSLSFMQINLYSFGYPQSLRTLDVFASVPSPSGPVATPFHAWTAAPQGATRVKFLMQLDPTQGLLVRANQGSDTKPAYSSVRLMPGTGTAPKLKAGVYVIAEGVANLAGFIYNPANLKAPLIASNGAAMPNQYIVMVVSHALQPASAANQR